MDVLRQNHYICLFIAFLIPIGQYWFQSHLFTFAFGLIILFILAVAFLPEEVRLFIWMGISFLLGLFAFIYGERLLYLFTMPEADLYIFSRLLLLIPSFLLAYIIHKFGKKALSFLQFPKGKLQQNIKLAIIILFLIALVTFFLQTAPSFSIYIKAIIFALLNSFAIELLWRGILLNQMNDLIGEGLAIFFTSLSSALLYSMFGFSLVYCFLLFFLFLLLGTVTLKVKSIWPAFFMHTFIILILVHIQVIPFLHIT